MDISSHNVLIQLPRVTRLSGVEVGPGVADGFVLFTGFGVIRTAAAFFTLTVRRSFFV